MHRSFPFARLKHNIPVYSTLLALFLLIANSKVTLAQPVEIQWQQSIGGISSDGAGCINATADGGYITGGYSYSGISGNKTVASFGDNDYYIVKLDASGNIEWQKAYGGSGYDQLETVTQTPDGGYIVGGISTSPISGNKTEANVLGSIDIWILKLDASGNIEWQNAIGGSNGDYFGSIYPTADGGYLVGAYSYSGISGDKTEPVIGFSDYWILKLNAAGNITWQNTIGGTAAEYCFRAKEAIGGGYIISGVSNSTISGDKTEGTIGGVGGMDIWVIKLNAAGAIVWQNTIGGTGVETAYEMDITPDGGAIIGTQTNSNSSADKSENNISGGTTTYDYWVIRLDNNGNIVWENTLGGTTDDYLHALKVMNNGDVAVGGYSISPISGDKTEPMYGNADYWLIKLDSLGNTIYDKTIGGIHQDYCYDMTAADDGKIVMCGSSASDTTGIKTAPLYGINDFWIVKVDDICEPGIEICNAIDDDCNGLIDDGITVEIALTADGPLTFCQGNTVVLTATHTGETVQWTKNGNNIPGATGLTYTVNQKGTYACIATNDCNFAVSDNMVVTVNKNPTATISAGGPTSFCAGGSVTLTETPSAGCTYQWYRGANPIVGATSLSYIATTPGNYKCRVTKFATGCFKNSNSIAVFVPCRADELIANTNNTNLELYPNPANDVLHIQVANIPNYNQAFITDVMGKMVYQFEIIDGHTELNIAFLPAGFYAIHYPQDNNILTANFIKQ